MTVPKKPPTVLHVDDAPDELRTWADQVNDDGRVRLLIRHPNEVTQDDVSAASLVLVDYRLESWPERDAAPSFGLKPQNGLALLAVLQEGAATLDKSPRAFALYTAALRDLAKGLAPQPYIVARAHNLEWIFDKSRDSQYRRQHVAELAVAVDCLPRPWPNDPADAVAALKSWLALPLSAPWVESAWRSILRCRPPLHDFAQSTQGIGVLRWMLHRILPYPTFLFDDVHLAARLRVDPASLVRSLSTSPELRLAFEPARYCGSLAGIVGRRWWRSGIESLIFDFASDDPASLELLHKQLGTIASSLITLSSDAVFPVLGPEYSGTETLANPDEIVEVVPDDWPPYADTAWTLKSDLEEHPELMAAASLDAQVSS
jgi:hypothetical protein